MNKLERFLALGFRPGDIVGHALLTRRPPAKALMAMGMTLADWQGDTVNTATATRDNGEVERFKASRHEAAHALVSHAVGIGATDAISDGERASVGYPLAFLGSVELAAVGWAGAVFDCDSSNRDTNNADAVGEFLSDADRRTIGRDLWSSFSWSGLQLACQILARYRPAVLALAGELHHKRVMTGESIRDFLDRQGVPMGM